MPRFEPHPERRAAVITGASSGMGQATALALAATGHPVVLAARRVDRLAELAAKINADGGEAVGLPLDLADPESIDTFAAAAESAAAPIEIVVSNAGEVLPATVLGTDPDAFAGSVHVNLLGAQRLVHRLAPPMVERGRGDLVFVSSDVVRVPRTRMSSYVTAKHGLEGMARALQMELEGTGVRASIVRPGPASTEQGTTWPADVVDAVVDDWARWGLVRHGGALRAREIAEVIATVVHTPRGTHLTLVEIEPEAPVTSSPSP
ncbi:MAG TPA: SDR family oxidoreductase [Acidimicrobiales bacterium]